MDYYWLSITAFGLIFLVVGISSHRKSKLFNKKCEHTEAYVSRIYHTKHARGGKRKNVYIPYAEYTVDGRKISGKHFMPVRHKFIKFHEGDTITVAVNHKCPEIFCIDTVDIRQERRTSVKMIVFGIIVIIFSLFVMLVRTQLR